MVTPHLSLDSEGLVRIADDVLSFVDCASPKGKLQHPPVELVGRERGGGSRSPLDRLTAAKGPRMCPS
jgi:hypothetical protein